MKPAIERGEKCYNVKLTEEQVRLARIYVIKGPIGTLPHNCQAMGCRKANASQCRSRKKLEMAAPADSGRN
jgi:hypothetical protein